MALALWWLSGSLGIGVTYHRLLTHRGFRVPKPLEYLGTLAGMLASEGGAISWVAMHRMHHARSDVPGADLHTPKDGFWWSHIGWVLCKDGLDVRERNRRYAPELVADPVHRALERIHWAPNVLLGLMLFALGGWPLLVWGGFVRLLLTLHGTWLVNSATHTWGYRTWRTKDDSRNLWWVGLLAWGEGWHNTHHAFQRSARHGFGWELDANWLVIRTLAGSAWQPTSTCCRRTPSASGSDPEMAGSRSQGWASARPRSSRLSLGRKPWRPHDDALGQDRATALTLGLREPPAGAAIRPRSPDPGPQDRRGDGAAD